MNSTGAVPKARRMDCRLTESGAQPRRPSVDYPDRAQFQLGLVRSSTGTQCARRRPGGLQPRKVPARAPQNDAVLGGRRTPPANWEIYRSRLMNDSTAVRLLFVLRRRPGLWLQNFPAVHRGDFVSGFL